MHVYNSHQQTTSSAGASGMSDPVWQHAEDTCDKCNSIMDFWKTEYLKDGYDYLSWVCRNDDCGDIEDRHDYHNKESAP